MTDSPQINAVPARCAVHSERVAVHEVEIANLRRDFEKCAPLTEEILIHQAATQRDLSQTAKTLAETSRIQHAHTLQIAEISNQVAQISVETQWMGAWLKSITKYGISLILIILMGSVGFWANNHNDSPALPPVQEKPRIELEAPGIDL